MRVGDLKRAGRFEWHLMKPWNVVRSALGRRLFPNEYHAFD